MKSVFIFTFVILMAWLYIHVGFFVINLVETRVWADMTGIERIQCLTGSILVISSIFWIFALDVIMGKLNGR